MSAMLAISKAATGIGSRWLGTDVEISGVSSDSRSIGPGELFIALRGHNFDGHTYLAQAQSRGAVAAMVSEAGLAVVAQQPNLPALLVVDDTRMALGRLAQFWRRSFTLPLIAVTGSNGKTTTKEMIAAILRAAVGEVDAFATQGNLNNEIGLPLTLLRLRKNHQLGVVELGMNHPGEISYLADIARPTVALVNNAQREHLEFMRSVADVAEENGSVFDVLGKAGVAVFPADDEFSSMWREQNTNRKIVDFALDAPAAVTATYALDAMGSDVHLKTSAGEADVRLAIPGVHNVRNALAATACALAAGISLQHIAAGLVSFAPVKGRMQIKNAACGATMIDDTYNANPDSVCAAIDVLAAIGKEGARTMLILGDMGEVGTQGKAFHAEVGRYAKDSGVTMLLGLGELTVDAVMAFGAGGRHFDSAEMLASAATGQIEKDMTVLVKGSRFMHMERIVAALSGEEK